jgi:Protein of unknown function (DUF1549)/Protein of unknown function (DUF1553)
MRRMPFGVCGALLMAVLASSPASLIADELAPPDRPIEDAIDQSIDAELAAAGITPAPPADDANFIRRVTLDLAGRIPTPAEVEAFIKSAEPDRKARLVDRLLASADFPYHQRNEFDILLMAGKGNGEWRDWLLKTLSENRPWPELFREVILPREGEESAKAAATFLKSRAMNVDDMTNDTSRLFFGVSINCAKCHDHPLVTDWTQDHYFGMASFFSRTYLTKKNFLAEREEGKLKFRTTAGEEKEAKLLYLTSAEVSEPSLSEMSDADRQAAEAKQKGDNDRTTPPEPARYSRRAQLVDIALRPDPNGFFARSFANRVWARLLGRGLVMPLDQMHSENKPSHPELLSWLARDIEVHGYDLRRLIRGIVLSRAYGRSSRWEQEGERPAEKLFAVASVRPLTPMQYALSLGTATRNPAELAQRLENAEQWSGFRKDVENQAQGFAQQLEIPGENFQIGVNEALLFNNAPQVASEYLRDAPDRLVGTLKAETDREQMIQKAHLAVLSRAASPEEVAAISQYLAARDDRPAAAIEQFVWMLITGSEFRFNY